ncbi:MAG TPA: hypothetical protein VFW70_13285 [Methylomirabilota bacterium]|nr:hypothetical protein [Methylomirabilota bacterium]
MSAVPSTRRTAVWLFLFLNCLLVLTSSGRVRVIDEVLPVYQVESLAERGSTAVPQAVAADFFFGKRDLAGQPQAPYPPGEAAVGVPWYLAGKHVLRRLPGVGPRARTMVSDFAIVASSASFVAAAAALAFVLFVRLGLTHRQAVIASLGMTAGTPLFAYSAWYFSEPLTVAVLMIATVAVFSRPPGALPIRDVIIAGAALGFLLWIRPANIVTVPVVLAAMLVRPGGLRQTLPGAVVAGVIVGAAGLALLARNAALFGNALDFGYPATVEGGRRMIGFDTPVTVGLFAFMLSPGKSMLLFAPLLVLAPWALPRAWRRSRALAVLMLAPLVALLAFYSRYTQFDGGYSFGPRYLIPGIWLLGLSLGFVVKDGSPALRRIAAVLVLAGALVNVIGMATSPLEDMAGGRYYDQQSKYRLDYNPLRGQLELLAKYAADPNPAPIGRGFDRWFVFLYKGGVSATWLALVGGTLAAACIAAGWQLKRSLDSGP